MESLGYETSKEANRTPDRQVRRWLLEIKLAKKREKDWRKSADDIWKRYRAKDGRGANAAKKNAFNILWANTETLRPALYNSPPKPDVRRRYRSSDILGKAVGEVSERALIYCSDAGELDSTIKLDVLDALLPGRAVSRVRYVPSFKEVGTDEETHEEEGEQSEDAAHEPFEGNQEEVEFEQTLIEHVQWDDFLHGPGKTWDEVQWEAFRHRLTRDDLIEQFGEKIGKAIQLDATDDEDVKKKENEDLEDVFKSAELWEVWDKGAQKVFFVAASYKTGLIYAKPQEGEEEGEPPLKLRGFFPTPRPLMLVEDSASLLPIPVYEEYRQQAEELDSIAGRINLLVRACRVRFAYDPSLTELSELMKAADNEGIPVTNARQWINNAGLEKAIWWMPIEQLVKVLAELYKARELCKQTIYELTGISDIVRGATDPNETLGAQQLKANYSSVRLQKMQREVQRYVRDLMRLMAEVIGEHFSKETLIKMTGLNFPDAQQKQALQLQASAMSAQGQPIPDEMQKTLMMPAWDDIMAVLQSDMQREYRVDVETNSTVAETLAQDMQGLQQVLTGLTQFWQAAGPAVEAGAIKIDVIKSISLQICRRAKLGLEVEDALETGMQQPQPQNNGKAQAEQMKVQHEAALAQQQQAHEQQIAQRDQLHEQEIAQREQAMEQQRIAMEDQGKERQAQRDAEFDRWKAELDAETKIIVAEIQAGAASPSVGDAEEKANTDYSGKQAAQGLKRQNPLTAIQQAQADHSAMLNQHAQNLSQTHQQLGEALGQVAQHLAALHEQAAAPAEIVRSPDGKAVGVRKGNRVMQVKRGPDGRAAGLQ